MPFLFVFLFAGPLFAQVSANATMVTRSPEKRHSAIVALAAVLGPVVEELLTLAMRRVKRPKESPPKTESTFFGLN